MKTNDIIHSIINDHFTNDELDSIANAIQYTRKNMARVNTVEIKVGDNVKFSNRGVHYKGTVTKINRTTINVHTNKGDWKVPANMLTVE